MKPSRCSLLSLLGLAGLALAVEPNTMEDYVVRRGQTVSYIAFIKYGAYNDSIGGMLRKDNPQVQDLDKIQVGQVIKLRKEAKAPVVTEKEPARRIQLASRKAVVTMVQGSGEIRRFKGKREPLQANRFLSMGDTIVTGADGFAELIIDNQSILRLSSATEVRLTAIQEPSKVTSKESRSLVTTFFLARGKTWTKVQKWAGGLVRYQVQMPKAVAGVHGTVFENEVKDDSAAVVAVHQGEVGVTGGSPAEAPKKGWAPKKVSGPKEIALAEWVQVLKDGQKLEVSSAGVAGAPSAFTADPNSEWVKINQERDCLCD
ncbi:MAG: FecR domain-containing protein [Fibrobacteres bacterium]|nr:FecR domain-containing protein [Fibrobacterota bacterium]